MNYYHLFAAICAIAASIFTYLGQKKESNKTSETIIGHIDKKVSAADEFPPTGSITINEGRESTTSLKVNVTLHYSSNTKYYRISKDPNFIDQQWQPITDFTQFKFSSPGKKTLYVQFSSNGFSSPPMSSNINIYLPPIIKDVFIYKFDFKNKKPLIGYSQQYITKNEKNGKDTFIASLNTEYPGYQMASDIPDINPDYHITHWRYAFDDQELNRMPWNKQQIITWNTIPPNIKRYHYPIEPPLEHGEHILKFQIKSKSGESKPFIKKYYAKPSS